MAVFFLLTLSSIMGTLSLRIIKSERNCEMSKSSKRKKLTPEELKEENARIKAELAKTTEVESQQRITDLLSKENWIAILLAVLLPPIGIWYIWRRKEKHKLNLPSMVVWTMISVVILVQYIIMIVQAIM